MPVSAGSHPMILIRETPAQVRYAATGLFPVDEALEVPKSSLESLPDRLRRDTFGPVDPGWDHCLGGWTGSAEIRWAAERLTLVLSRQDSVSNCLQCWGGNGTVFAFEQQIAPADAPNLLTRGHGACGMVILDPGKIVRFHHVLEMRRD